MRWTLCLMVTLLAMPVWAGDLATLKKSVLEGDYLERRSALETLVESHGRDAVPVFREALRSGSLDVRRAGLVGLRQLAEDAADAVPDLVIALRDGDAAVRGGAGQCLVVVGPSGRAAADPLRTAALAEPDLETRYLLLDAMAKLDPTLQGEVIAMLAKELEHGETDHAGGIADWLADFETPAVAVLMRFAVGKDATRADAALQALARQSFPLDPKWIPTLRRIWRERSRKSATKLLARCGPSCAIAVPEVVDWLLANPAADRECGELLSAAGPAAVHGLMTLATRADEKTRSLALRLLRDLGEDAGPAVPVVAEFLADRDAMVRIAALDVLQNVGPRAGLAMHRLRMLARTDPVEHIRSRALGIMLAIEPSLERWRELYRGSDPLGWEVARRELHRLGPQRRQALAEVRDALRRCPTRHDVAMLVEFSGAVLPDLIDLCRHVDADIAQEAAKVLEQANWLPSADTLAGLQELVTAGPTPARLAGLSMLRRMGPTARPALPLLRRLARDEKDEAVRTRSRVAVFYITGESEYVVEAIRDAQQQRDADALRHVLWLADRLPDEAVGVVVDIATENHKIARPARAALRDLGPRAGPFVPRLVADLRTLDRARRQMALVTLALLGPTAREAEPTLRRLLTDPAEPDPLLVAYTRANVDPTWPIPPAVWDAGRSGLTRDLFEECPEAARVFLPLLRKELGHPVKRRREDAAVRLQTLGHDAAVALPELRVILKDRCPGVRRAALQAVAGLGEAARPAVPEVLRMLEDEHAPIPEKAAGLLLDLGVDCRSVLRPLASRLTDEALRDRGPLIRHAPDGSFRLAPYQNTPELRRIVDAVGPPLHAIPAARLALRESGPSEFAVWVLGRCGPAAREAVPDLLVALDRGNVEAPRALADVDAETARPALRRIARSESRLRYQAAAELMRLGPGDWALALEVLREGLRDPEVLEVLHSVAKWQPRLAAILLAEMMSQKPHTAAKLLGRLGNAGVPALVDALRDWRAGSDGVPVCARAAEALGELGPVARDAVPALRRLRDSGPARLRAIAADALRRIER